MTRFVLTLAALALIASGCHAPAVQQSGAPASAAALPDPSIPGSGYQIPAARPGSQPPYPRDPLAEYLSNSERYGK